MKIGKPAVCLGIISCVLLPVLGARGLPSVGILAACFGVIAAIGVQAATARRQEAHFTFQTLLRASAFQGSEVRGSKGKF